MTGGRRKEVRAIVFEMPSVLSMEVGRSHPSPLIAALIFTKKTRSRHNLRTEYSAMLLCGVCKAKSQNKLPRQITRLILSITIPLQSPPYHSMNSLKSSATPASQARHVSTHPMAKPTAQRSARRKAKDGAWGQLPPHEQARCPGQRWSYSLFQRRWKLLEQVAPVLSHGVWGRFFHPVAASPRESSVSAR